MGQRKSRASPNNRKEPTRDNYVDLMLKTLSRTREGWVASECFFHKVMKNKERREGIGWPK